MTLKIIDSYTAREEKHLMSLYELFTKALNHDTRQARRIYDDHIHPYMLAQLKTMRIMDDQLMGAAEQNRLLLKSNVLLIDAIKQNGVPMPNLDALARERVQEEGDFQA